MQKPQRDKVPGLIIPFTVSCFSNRIVLFKLLSAQTPPHTPSFCKCGVKNVGKCVTTLTQYGFTLHTEMRTSIKLRATDQQMQCGHSHFNCAYVCVCVIVRVWLYILVVRQERQVHSRRGEILLGYSSKTQRQRWLPRVQNNNYERVQERVSDPPARAGPWSLDFKSRLHAYGQNDKKMHCQTRTDTTTRPRV